MSQSFAKFTLLRCICAILSDEIAVITRSVMRYVVCSVSRPPQRLAAIAESSELMAITLAMVYSTLFSATLVTLALLWFAIADLRAEVHSDLQELRTELSELKADTQADRADIRATQTETRVDSAAL